LGLYMSTRNLPRPWVCFRWEALLPERAGGQHGWLAGTLQPV